jgi:hypothetical protein
MPAQNGGKATTGDEVRQVCEAMLLQQEIDRVCKQFGVIARQGKMHLGMFMRAMVIVAGTPGTPTMWRSYVLTWSVR